MVSRHTDRLGLICLGFQISGPSCIFENFPSPLVAMLKQVLFDHMMSREAEEEKEETEENKQTGSPGCQLSASLPESPEGLSAVCEENQASASLQKDGPVFFSGHTGPSETTERNGELIM